MEVFDEDFEENLEHLANLATPPRKVYRPRPDPLAFPDDVLIERYRFPLAVILELTDLLKDDLQHPTSKSAALPAHLQLLAALKFYATGTTLAVGSEIHNVSKTTIWRSVDAVSKALVAKREQFIVFPADLDSLITTANKFYDIAGFPSVVGCIDGTQIPIIRPRENEDVYVCRKMYHSINVQIICDADLVITNIVARWPGSTHDSFILHSSAINHSFENGDIEFGLLLGDSGYALKSWLMTPLLNPTTQQEVSYNWAHIRTRSTVERTIGVLKSRFRSIAKASGPLRQTPSKCCQTIVTSAILHNIARRKKLPEPDLIDEDEDPAIPFEDVRQSQINEIAMNVRRTIIARF